MDLGGGLVEATFLERLNRFAARVEFGGREELCHVANSGRMRELLVPGFRVWLKHRPGDHRKTSYDLALVELGTVLSSADARLPNALVREALSKGALPEFSRYTQVKAESTYGESRLDFLLENPSIPPTTAPEIPAKCYLETKSVTLVESGTGLFPDAPTSRGVKHLGSLVKAVEAGNRAAVIFVVQRPDARRLSPNDPADPDFAVALRRALAAGVEAFAYRCRVSLEEIELSDRLPIVLPPLDCPDPPSPRSRVTVQTSGIAPIRTTHPEPAESS